MAGIWNSCRACGTTFLMPEPGRHQCPGCNLVYLYRKAAPAAAPAESRGESRAAAPEAPREVPPPAPGEPGESEPAAGLSRLRWAGFALGILSLAAAGLVLLRGPFDGGQREAARESLAEAKRKVEELEAEIESAEARRGELAAHEEEARGRTVKRRAQAELLAKQKAKLDRHDLELSTLERQLTWLEGRRKEPARPAEPPAAPAGVAEAVPPGEPPPSSRPARSMSAAEKAVVVIKTGTGSGSGFVVEASGLVATNYHVIEGSSRVSVEIQKRDSSERIEIEGVAVAAVDADHDLALLRLGPAPGTVAVGGGYPVLELRISPAVHLGERVYALGNPGLGRSILEYTLTEGVVSSRRRELDDVAFIQTSAAINPGNSGGPLLDAQGLAVGVVTAKGANVEAVGFAIPAETLKQFLVKRDQPPLVVAGKLEDWEKKNRPLTALLRKGPTYRDSFAVELEEQVDFMALAPGRGVLYLLAAGSFQVRQFDLSKRKVEGSFRADSEITALDLDSAGDALYLTAGNKVLKVGARSMKLEGEAPLPRRPLGMTCLKDSGDLCAVLERDAPLLLSRFGRSPSVPLAADRGALACASSAQWLCLLRAGAEVELIAYPVGDLKKQQALEKLRKDAGRQGFPISLVSQITDLEKEVARSRSLYSLARGSSSEEGGLVPEIIFAGPGRVIVGRRIFRLGPGSPGITLEARFAPGPYAVDERPEMRRQRSYFLYMDNIFSASPDGSHAASGTHIYSVKSRKPIRELPFPASVHVFSGDGSTLYLYDGARRSLYLLQGWQANTRALQN